MLWNYLQLACRYDGNAEREPMFQLHWLKETSGIVCWFRFCFCAVVVSLAQWTMDGATIPVLVLVSQSSSWIQCSSPCDKNYDSKSHQRPNDAVVKMAWSRHASGTMMMLIQFSRFHYCLALDTGYHSGPSRGPSRFLLRESYTHAATKGGSRVVPDGTELSVRLEEDIPSAAPKPSTDNAADGINNTSC
jgi:hypothetical protein